MDEEEPDASKMSLDEDLVNETVTYNDDCDTEMSEEFLPGPPGRSARTRTPSATYTFPDPEQPSRNLVLEFPVGPPQSQTSATAESVSGQGNELKMTSEERAEFANAIAESQLDVEPLKDGPGFTEQSLDVSYEVPLTQPKALLIEPPIVADSPWMSYMQQRIQNSGNAYQRATQDRQKALFRVLTDDHSYGQQQPSSAVEGKPVSTFIRSKKTLFFSDNGLISVAGGDCSVEGDRDFVVVDVGTEGHHEPADVIVRPYNRVRAYAAMNEMERFMYHARGSADVETALGKDGKADEDPLVKTYTKRGTWTSRQRSLFDACIKILQYERYARLASIGVPDEPIVRRLSLDKAAGRFRRLMASVEWSGRLVYWLHQIMVDGLNSQMLAMYFEILQTLKPKIPELVNSLVTYMLPPVTVPGACIDGLVTLLDNPWDPVGKSVYRFDKSIKLPKNPILVIAPHPYSPQAGHEKLSHSRIQSIIKFFTRLGTVVQVDGGSNDNLTPSDLYKNMLVTTRDTLIDLRKIHMDRPLVMIGLGIGSMVACQASLLEPCAAVICFGFPLKTPRGVHGDYGNPLLKLDAAVQFILGLDAGNCPHAEFHDFWEKLNCDTEVVWSAGCDDYLRMNHAARMSLKMTQAMVDRCFLEAVIQFLQQALLKDRPRRVEPVVPETSKKRKGKAATSFTSSRTPTKKAKSETQALDPDEKHGKKADPPLSESTTSSQDLSSSQELSNGGNSQSSCDTLPAAASDPPSQADAPPMTGPPTTDTRPVPACGPKPVPACGPCLPDPATAPSLLPLLNTVTDPPVASSPSARPNEQSTLSIHFTTSQALTVSQLQLMRRQDVYDAHRRMYETTSRNAWLGAPPIMVMAGQDGRGNGAAASPRMVLPRGSVIAHTNTRMTLPAPQQHGHGQTSAAAASLTATTLFRGLPPKSSH